MNSSRKREEESVHSVFENAIITDRRVLYFGILLGFSVRDLSNYISEYSLRGAIDHILRQFQEGPDISGNLRIALEASGLCFLMRDLQHQRLLPFAGTTTFSTGELPAYYSYLLSKDDDELADIFLNSNQSGGESGGEQSRPLSLGLSDYSYDSTDGFDTIPDDTSADLMSSSNDLMQRVNTESIKEMLTKED